MLRCLSLFRVLMYLYCHLSVYLLYCNYRVPIGIIKKGEI
nr:MAG TPA: hypothetical protein [Caudoviricetes sp.]